MDILALYTTTFRVRNDVSDLIPKTHNKRALE